MPDQKPSDKLNHLLTNDLHEFYKEASEDKTIPIEAKIEMGQPFTSAMSQLKVCISILKSYGY